MESLAARNLAAMAISVHPVRRCWRKESLRDEMCSAVNDVISLALLRGGSGLALPVRKDFSDEEDYVEAGGSELLFVQMQQSKRSKLSEKTSE